MPSRALDVALAPQQRVLTILWAALLASVGIYLVVAYVVAEQMEPATEDSGTLVIAMAIAAVASAIASMVLPGKLLSDGALRRHLRSARPAPGKAESSGREQRLARAGGLYMVPWLLGVILAEGIAVLGLGLVILTGEPSLMIPFAIVAAALIVSKRPNLRGFMDRAEKLSL
jgi:hypothetical protein